MAVCQWSDHMQGPSSVGQTINDCQGQNLGAFETNGQTMRPQYPSAGMSIGVPWTRVGFSTAFWCGKSFMVEAISARREYASRLRPVSHPSQRRRSERFLKCSSIGMDLGQFPCFGPFLALCRLRQAEMLLHQSARLQRISRPNRAVYLSMHLRRLAQIDRAFNRLSPMLIKRRCNRLHQRSQNRIA